MFLRVFICLSVCLFVCTQDYFYEFLYFVILFLISGKICIMFAESPILTLFSWSYNPVARVKI